MGAFRFGIYLSVILMTVSKFVCSNAVTQQSAVISHVTNVQNGLSPAKLIECAFQLMKKEEKYFVRIAAGTDVCEQLDRPSLMDSRFYMEGFEYLQKSIMYVVNENLFPYLERVIHYIYSEVETGDTFTFFFHKMNTDTMLIIFRNTTHSTYALTIKDDSTKLTLNDRFNYQRGPFIKPAYPFQAFKIYKILCEVLESYWQISVNDKVLTTFDHRVPLEHIKVIAISTGPSLKYLSKGFNPRNQPPDLTGW